MFYTDDKTWYTSPWFGGKHRIMIPFGCTEAPYYSPDPRCTDDGHARGFHHGIDIAMACGTKLFAARRATVGRPGVARAGVRHDSAAAAPRRSGTW